MADPYGNDWASQVHVAFLSGPALKSEGLIPIPIFPLGAEDGACLGVLANRVRTPG
jgi:hypothetical protein